MKIVYRNVKSLQETELIKELMGKEWTEKTNKWSSEVYCLLKHNVR